MTTDNVTLCERNICNFVPNLKFSTLKIFQALKVHKFIKKCRKSQTIEYHKETQDKVFSPLFVNIQNFPH
jgi:hypothetical protein